LSLFFIDEVAKYRDYDNPEDMRGEYARIFEEEYNQYLNEVLSLEGLNENDTAYNKYLKNIATKKHMRDIFPKIKRKNL